MNLKFSAKVYPFYMIVPALLIYVVFFLFPNLFGFYYSFTNWNAMSTTVKFIGWENFRDIFANMRDTSQIVKNTFIFAFFSTVLKMAFGLALAVMLNEGIKSRNVLRAIFFLPITISPLIIGMIFAEIFHPETGALNRFLDLVGLDALRHSWITEPKLAIWSVTMVEVWKASGFAMAIFVAAMQMVPKSVYEAAEIDGANAWHKFKSVTIPYLMPAISINTILGMISGLKVFDMIYPITSGGPGRATEVINIKVFNEFSNGAYGLSTAYGLLLFLFITVIAFAILKFFARAEVE